MWKVYDNVDRDDSGLDTFVDSCVDWDEVDEAFKTINPSKYDSYVGHWIEGIPYVWVHHDDVSQCQRKYILSKDDIVYNKDVQPNSSTYLKSLDKLLLKDTLHLHNDPSHTLSAYQLKNGCEYGVAERFFRVYNCKRDGFIKNLIVRVNGKDIKPKPKKLSELHLKENIFRIIRKN